MKTDLNSEEGVVVFAIVFGGVECTRGRGRCTSVRPKHHQRDVDAAPPERV